MDGFSNDGADAKGATSAARLFANRFVLEKEAGRGGMGLVYRAFDKVAGITVALKVLRRSEPSTVRRFAMEAEALERLDHANIVRCLAHGVGDDGAPWIAIEWIEGENLRDRVARAIEENHQLEVLDVVELGQKLAAALGAAHAVGIVHRDVKPSNILLASGSLQRPKLADFGIVRADGGEHPTTSGTVLGTVGYMAPEQARGQQDLDGRADLFSLGCVLFRCLTQQEAFDAPDPMAMLSLLLLHQPAPVASLRPEVPPELDELVTRLLAKDRADRPASATEVKTALARIAADLLGETQTSQRSFETAKPDPSREADASHAASVRRQPKSLSRFAAVSGAALAVLAGGWLFAHRTPEARGKVPAVADAAVVPAPVATTVLDLPISPSCTPGATTLYHEGMRALHGGRWRSAARIFLRATEADPTCPQALLRQFLIGRGLPTPLAQEYLRKAVAVRDALSERDRTLLDLFVSYLSQEPASPEKAEQMLSDAMARYPGDVEFYQMAAEQKLNATLPAFPAAIELAHRATELDPSSSDAWQLLAQAYGRLGRANEQRAALDRCLEVAPGSVDCMTVAIKLRQRAGLCDAVVSDTKRLISWDPEGTTQYALLADSLASVHAPRDAIEEALRLRWERQIPSFRIQDQEAERAQLDIWMGDFTDALAATDELEHRVQSSVQSEDHWRAAILKADVLFEIGQNARASRTIDATLRRRNAWIHTERLRPLDALDMESQLNAQALRAGRLTLAQWREDMNAWDASSRDTSEANRWILRWGPTLDSPTLDSRIDVRELAGPRPAADINEASFDTFYLGVRDEYDGRIHLAIGDDAGAIALLERGTAVCQGLQHPMLAVRARLWLGIAREHLGQRDAACNAYQFVVSQWGKASPPSLTAREAARRSRALACPK